MVRDVTGTISNWPSSRCRGPGTDSPMWASTKLTAPFSLVLPVAVTFLYTSCPVATACPMTTAKFSRLDAMLKEKGFGKLLVVTVDPLHDTPAVLAAYAGKAGADPSRWKFLTGTPTAVAQVASSFGVVYYFERGQVIHGQAVAVVGPDGRLASIYYGENWEPEHLLRDLEKARKG